MRVVKVPKGRSGKYRTLYIPDSQEREKIANYSSRIKEAAEKADTHGIAHGFRRSRSPLTNASQHIGFRYTLCFDLQDWFPSIKPEHVPEEFRIPILFPDGACQQGIPTSPDLANIAAMEMDNAIMALRTKGRFGWVFQYSRFADDLSFSFNIPAVAEFLMKEIPAIVERMGYRINPSKTRVQSARAGRRIITGYAVGETDIRIPRYMRRRMRAALHQRHTSQYRGLLEFARMKLPKAWVKDQKEARDKAAAATRMPQERSQASGGINSAPTVVGPYKRKLSLE